MSMTSASADQDSTVAARGRPENITIHLLDVGQGDAMIVHQPGAAAMLIDAGPLLHGARVAARIVALGVDELDTIIVTHPHLDHFGGLFNVLVRVRAAHLFDNGGVNEAWEYFDDYRQLCALQPYRVLTRGETLACGPVRVEVLHPPAESAPGRSLNDTSLVSMISINTFRLLHMGDLAGPAEAGFLAAGDDLRAEVIKIAHHGAADAASDELLDRVAPSYALISTASSNRIGSPAETVLDRLAERGITVLRTDRDGDIEIAVTPAGFTVAPAER